METEQGLRGSRVRAGPRAVGPSWVVQERGRWDAAQLGFCVEGGQRAVRGTGQWVAGARGRCGVTTVHGGARSLRSPKGTVSAGK